MTNTAGTGPGGAERHDGRRALDTIISGIDEALAKAEWLIDAYDVRNAEAGANADDTASDGAGGAVWPGGPSAGDVDRAQGP